jgi:hypothetical protein
VADVQQIVAQPGPLPLQVTADIESDAPFALTLAGSVWTTASTAMIGVELQIDDDVAARAQIFSNAPSTHRAVVPVTVPVTLTIGPHVLTLVPLTPQTTSDANDFFAVTVVY